MTIVSRYIFKHIATMVGLVLLILASMEIFIRFFNELGDIGGGNYTAFRAFVYVLFHMPSQVYMFIPIASLIGGLMGLGLMATHRELVVLRASGQSVMQIMVMVLKATLILVIVVSFVGEVLAPKASHFAENLKAQSLSGGQATRTSEGIWLRDNDNFIHIGHALPGGRLENISRYMFNAKHQLVLSSYAKYAQYKEGRWDMFDVKEYILSEDSVQTRTYDVRDWGLSVMPSLISVTSVDPSEMSLVTLYHYIQEQEENRSQAGRYELSFWQRIYQPLATLVMMMLAIPFVFGPLRSATMGFRLLIGVACGFGFYLLNQFFGPISLVYQFPTAIMALLPTLLFGLIATLMLKRVK